MATRKRKRKVSMEKRWPKYLAEAIESNAMTVLQLSQKADVDRRTIERHLKGGDAQAGIVERYAAALNWAPHDLYYGRRSQNSSSSGIGEWNFASPPSATVTAPNNLQWSIRKLQLKVSPSHLARGKLYDLSTLPDAARDGSLQYLVGRHTEIASRLERRFGSHPNVAQPITAFQDTHSLRWWVLDRWIEGEALVDTACPVSPERIKPIVEGLIAGFTALHSIGVILRYIGPRSVMLDGTRPVLADLELSKLVGDSLPTVVPSDARWTDELIVPTELIDEDPHNVDERTDVYYVALFVAILLGGQRVAPVGAQTIVKASLLPEGVKKALTKSLMALTSRPSMQEVEKAIKKWR